MPLEMLVRPDTSLHDASRWLKNNAPGGALCPCCLRFDKVYNRPVCRSAVSNLAALYRLTHRKGAGFYHYSEFFRGKVFPGDMARLAAIGIVERAPSDVQNRKASGMYRITITGEQFVRGELAIPERLIFYHNELLGVSHNTKLIAEFWPEFNYMELMR